MSRRELLVFTVIGAALVLAVIVGTGLGWWNGRASGGVPAERLLVRTSLQPRPVYFGDLVTAEVEVQIDRGTVDAESVRVVPSFVPFLPVGSPTVSRSHVGRFETLRYRYGIQCVSDDCLPKRKDPLVLQLKPVVVTAGTGRQRLKATGTWPRTAILARLQEGDLGQNPPPLRRPRTAPAPVYAVSPGGLATGLTIAAGLLGAIGLTFLGRELLLAAERRRRRRLVLLTPLEEALAYTRDAAQRDDPDDRRKALELLAKALDAEGAAALADTAGDVAWSEEPPTPDKALELADEVEGATRNGR